MRKKRKLGFGFVDEIYKVTAKNKPPQKKIEVNEWKDSLLPNFDPNIKEFDKNPWITTSFLILILVSFFLIFLRLISLQIVKGSINRELADSNRIQVKIIHAPRGVIYDRNNTILAANSPAFRLFDKETNKTKLITREEALELEVKNNPASADLEVDNVRNYPSGGQFAHVVGFTGEISEDQLNSSEYANYHQGDRIGKMGVEAQYEKILRGKDGGEIIEVDSSGRKIRTLRRNAPIPGQNIYLNIDTSLQKRLYDLMKEALAKVGSCCGAAVVADPRSGQILALLSFPAFDPNLFTQSGDEGAISQILSQPDSPILNRAIAGTYPPGSTFKIISSLAALASGKITANTTFYDNGVIYLGPYKFTNWFFNQYGKTEGPVNLIKAIERSNDTYFYEVARIIGEDALASWARKLKLGSKLEIDIPGEMEGLVPDDAWKKKMFNLPWYPGDTLHMAIGQGFVLTTPLQILGITSYIASDGVLYKPQIISENSKVLISNLLALEKINLVKEGLQLVTKSRGTAWPFYTFPIETAGKTGTAEYGDTKNRTHAWYTAYAPAGSDDPKIVMTVLIEGGGEGSSVASPVVKETFRWFFSPDKNKLIQDVYIPATESARTLGE